MLKLVKGHLRPNLSQRQFHAKTVLKIVKSTNTFTNGDFPQLRIRLPKEFSCSISEKYLTRLALPNLPSTRGLSVAYSVCRTYISESEIQSFVVFPTNFHVTIKLTLLLSPELLFLFIGLLYFIPMNSGKG